MSVTLLHRFNVLVGLFSSHPEARQVSTLYELAALLWDVEAPGLAD